MGGAKAESQRLNTLQTIYADILSEAGRKEKEGQEIKEVGEKGDKRG